MQLAETFVATPRRRQHRRRLVPIIDPRFQWKYSLLVAGLLSLVGGVLGSLLYATRLESTRLLALSSDDPLLAEVAAGDRDFLIVLVASLITTVVIVTLLGLVVTQRISGPLLVCERYLAALSHGYLPSVRSPRRSDELRPLTRALEQTIESARHRQREKVQQLDATLLRLQQVHLQGRPQDALEQAIHALKAERDDAALSLGADINTDAVL
jgi:methyl-accepting chemotaxis protein